MARRQTFWLTIRIKTGKRKGPTVKAGQKGFNPGGFTRKSGIFLKIDGAMQ